MTDTLLKEVLRQLAVTVGCDVMHKRGQVSGQMLCSPSVGVGQMAPVASTEGKPGPDAW